MNTVHLIKMLNFATAGSSFVRLATNNHRPTNIVFLSRPRDIFLKEFKERFESGGSVFAGSNK
jgi:hypothetical protein